MGINPPWYESDRIAFNLFCMEEEERKKLIEKIYNFLKEDMIFQETIDIENFSIDELEELLNKIQELSKEMEDFDEFTNYIREI